MRREDIIRGFENVRAAIIEADIEAILRDIVRREKRFDKLKLFSTYSLYYKFHSTFGSAEKYTIDVFGLEQIGDPSFWSELYDLPDDAQHVLYNSHININSFLQYTPKFLELLKRDTDEEVKIIFNKKPIEAKSLNVILNEDQNSLFSPEQFIKIITSIRSIYDSLCRIHNVETDTLAIGSLDSGSKKQIDFIGASKIIDAIDQLLVRVWNRVRSSPEEKYEARIKAAAEAINLIEKINDSKAKKAITKIEAEKIRRTLVRSIQDLLLNGAYTKEMQKAESVTVEQVIHAQKELIEYKPRTPKKKKAKDETVDEATLRDNGTATDRLN